MYEMLKNRSQLKHDKLVTFSRLNSGLACSQVEASALYSPAILTVMINSDYPAMSLGISLLVRDQNLELHEPLLVLGVVLHPVVVGPALNVDQLSDGIFIVRKLHSN